MGLDEKGRPIVDVIDSMDEDPFTLDSFEKMIRCHAAKGKDFLLARVATVDPQDETRFYYSYYSAHQINKVLFRTQPEEGLLHRMKAKNPLNNMVIMGDVHYYGLSPSHSPPKKKREKEKNFQLKKSRNDKKQLSNLWLSTLHY
ncbi:hypothetical protein BDR26DRAFT_805798 [Obelidium mucronatum]|nr:hypothetical protein BDR26DRAFT_805798 [Obelidium mucronatum]